MKNLKKVQEQKTTEFPQEKPEQTSEQEWAAALKAVTASSAAMTVATEVLGAATGKAMVAIIARENELKKKMSLLPGWALIRLAMFRLAMFRLRMIKLRMIRVAKRKGLIMKNNILLVLLFFLIPIIVNGQTQEATTSDGKKVILNTDGTWKYAEEVTTSEGKKVILNADGTWKYAEQERTSDIQNRTKNALANSKNSGINSTSEGITGGSGNSGISYNLQGRGFRLLPTPRYEYQGEGLVVVEVSVDRSGKVTEAIPGGKGSTTLDEYLLTIAKEAAMKATFEPKPTAPLIQKGTITYNFILK